MNEVTRRMAFKILAASSILFLDNNQDKVLPKYVAQNADITFHTTVDYPARWLNVYKNTLDHFAKRWGKVGPTHIFLIENDDWPGTKNDDAKKKRLKESQERLRRTFCELHGDDSNGEHLDWQTGNHWTSWSLKPANLAITMTMTPHRDGEQFVIGPIHEYMHAIQTVYGFASEAIAGNKMGQALWTGPAWFREGSAVIVAALYAYLHPELFKGFENPFSWQKFVRELNRNLGLFQKAKTQLREGVTHNDWQRLEPQKLVYPVIYCGGSIACAMLLKRAGSLQAFMGFFQHVLKLGWKVAFEKHFGLTLAAFYKEFETAVSSAKVKIERDETSPDWFEFLKSLPESTVKNH